MKHYNKCIFRFLSLIIAMFLLSGCAGLPDGQVHQVESMPYRLIQQAELIKTKHSYFDNLKNNSEWEFIKPYLENEKWSKFLVKSENEYKTAQEIYTLKLLPMLERDDPEETSAFAVLIVKFNSHIKSSSSAAMNIEKRIAFLLKTRNTAPAIHKQVNSEYSKIKNIQLELTNKARQAYNDYPKKQEDIISRIDKLNDFVNQAETSKNKVTNEFVKRDAANYAILGDESVNVSRSLKTISDYQNTTGIKLDQLYKSYTKVLADQRIEYFVVVGRANWCEGEYCGEGSSRNYPPSQVDDKVYEYFDTSNLNTIATMRPGWSSINFKLSIPEAKWNALGIEKQWMWPRGDNYADYWINKLYVNTYHKYIEIVNDKMTEGTWVKVDETSFWKDYDNLGMAILTKPYGLYEDDALSEAQPVGIANIATPVMKNGVPTGSNQYGEWRHSNGSSFWYYYGMYSMFGHIGGSRRYGYNDWSSYNSRTRGKAYYGRNNEYGTYGSSTYSNTRYQNSDYAKRNPGEVRASKTGNSSRSKTSIRGAGSSSRSRGAAGGGK